MAQRNLPWERLHIRKVTIRTAETSESKNKLKQKCIMGGRNKRRLKWLGHGGVLMPFSFTNEYRFWLLFTGRAGHFRYFKHFFYDKK